MAKAESGIKSGADLKGKKVGSWFGGREYEFYALADKYGIDYEKDIEWVQQDYTLDQFNNDEIDVASAMSYNEYLLLLDEYDESATEEHQINMTRKVVETAVIPEGSTADQIGELDTERIQRTIDQGYSTGLISNKINIDESIDASYWKEAVAGLK